MLNFVKASKSFGPEELIADFLHDQGKLYLDSLENILQYRDLAHVAVNPKAQVVVGFFTKNRGDKYAPLLSKFIENDPFSENWLKIIFSEWTNHPELLRLYLQPVKLYDPVNSILKEGFLRYHSWLEHKDLLGAFLQKIIFPQQPIEGLKKTEWYKDLGVLREIFERALEIRNGNTQPVTLQILFHLLMEDGLGEKAPDLLYAILDHAEVGGEMTKLFQMKNLVQHPELMKKAIQKSRYALETKELVEQLANPEWANHPEVIRLILRESDQMPNQEYFRMALFKILEQPHWAKYPELLEELTLLAPQYVYPEKIEYLLDLPHWRDHPRFKPLRIFGKLSYTRFKLYVLNKTRAQEPLGTKVFQGCRDIFRSFQSPHF